MPDLLETVGGTVVTGLVAGVSLVTSDALLMGDTLSVVDTLLVGDTLLTCDVWVTGDTLVLAETGDERLVGVTLLLVVDLVGEM